METNSEKNGNFIIAGVDIGKDSTFLSFVTSGMEEPVTISTVMGSESYQIPTKLSKKKGIGQWFIGNDALSQERLSMAIGCDNFYEKALDDEKVYVEGEEFLARDLLSVYFRKLLSMPLPGIAKGRLSLLVICVSELNMKVFSTMNAVAQRLGLSRDRLYLIDKSESFYYYTLSQEKSIFLHDVLLIDYDGANLTHCFLQKDVRTRPVTVTLEKAAHGEVLDMKDERLYDIASEILKGRIGSGIYLTGDGFDGDWMKKSLSLMLQGRRLFLGKNLYSKGACYAGLVRLSVTDWPYVYIGDNELKLNISLKVIDSNEMKLITLLSAGENWYDEKGECECILDGTPSLELFVRKPDERSSEVVSLPLLGFPERENRTSRIRIEAIPLSDSEVKVIVTDLGFGEISPQTKKTWEHIIKAK